ncbi:MAG: preprotein translocase subunit SecG [Phycisphaerae bacterium]
MTTLFYIFATLMVFVCVLLVLLILIQKGRGGGLASAFGGGGGNTAFGAKTGDVLTWATSIVFGLLLVIAITTSMLSDTVHSRAVSVQDLPEEPTTLQQQEPVSPDLPEARPTPDPAVPDALEQTPPAASDPAPAANQPMITPEDAE